jgi:hypothetical protein
MNVLLVWSLETIESPRLITVEKHVIDLVKTDTEIWINYISVENKQRVLSEVQRWKAAVAAGADANQAYGYAIGGGGLDYWAWLEKEQELLAD